MREGVAEAIPLPDASVDAVTVADGFHWFNQAQALAEISRVLTLHADWLCSRPFRTGAEPLGRTSLARDPAPAPRTPRDFDGPPWQEAVRAATGWKAPREIRVITSSPPAQGK